MAYVNVAEWSPDQVSEWLKGLDEAILPYIHYFVNNQVDGKRLLQLSPDDLPSLRVTKIGHQEIVLQAVELLRSIHYQLNQENVQYLALRLSSKARSIYNELRLTSSFSGNGGGSAGEEEEGEDEEEEADRRNAKKRQERVSTAIIAGVADVLSSVKGLVSWLNRQPFEGQEKYDCLKSDLVELSIRLATIAQRDMFAENQATVILQLCLNLALISDKIIQEYSDPLIIQPASLDIATIKKKADDEWGVVLQSSYHGVHQVSGVRALSPAYQCGKLQEGDELVQVNYQTVIGWSPLKVTAVMQEFPVEVILTVKKRPRHANTVTQIYLKPMRLPSKKRTYSPWGSSLITSPRYDLQSIPNLQLSVSVDKVPIRQELNLEPQPKSSSPPPQLATPSPQPASSLSDAPSTTSDRESQDSDSEDDPFLSDSDLPGSSPISVRLYHPKPRAPVQRRATIPGATARPSLSFDQLLQDVKWSRSGWKGFPEGSAPSNPDLLRGPVGMDHRIARPHTCIGTENKGTLVREDKEAVLKEGTEDDYTVNEEQSDEEKSENIGDKDRVKNLNQDCGMEENKMEKKVVNIIPLPPRKPTNCSLIVSSQGSSPSPAHPPLSTEEKNVSRVRVTPALLSPGHPPPPQSSTASLDQSISLCCESSQDPSGRSHRISEDRPKLDKSHSTPAYDLNGDETLPVVTDVPSGVSSLLSSPCERSPATLKSPNNTKSGSGSTNFFSTYDIKGALVSPGEVAATLPQLGINAGYFSRMSPPHVTTPIISLATTTVGAGTAEHFKAQVIFPVGAAEPGHTSPEFTNKTKKTEGGPAAGEMHNSGGVGVGGDNGRHGTSDGGGINICEGRFSSSSSGISGVESMASQQMITPPACQPSTSTPGAVVLRETRSSSPSVWRRGLLVTDCGSRRISCRDLGQGDHQGWLYRRRDNKGFLLPHRWERRWFILKKNYLYGYRDREAVRADSLIYLPGFHVCPAADVKGKKFAFKIYHSSGATFYFACVTSEERSRWMSQMGLSAISSLTFHHRQLHGTQQQQQGEEVYYSETDEELEERSSPSRHSPQSSQPRTSPGKENIASLWRGGSSSPSRTTQNRGPPIGSLTTLSSGKSQGLRFLQPSRDVLNQPVPTASFRSYRRVSENNNRSTSTGDLRGVSKPEMYAGQAEAPASTEGGTSRRVTRKNSLRDRLRQLPAPFTMERRRQTNRGNPNSENQQKQQQQRDLQKEAEPQQMEEKLSHKISAGPLSEDVRHSILSCVQQIADGQSGFHENSAGIQRQRPHYMLPTCASSQHSPARPSSVDLDTRSAPNKVGNGRWVGTPPPSGRCSPSKIEVRGRRGSTGGESPIRSRSPRRGSLDCLAWSHPRAISPPMSPLHTPSRSSHGSASSLLASEEYREGSPEKLWISSLRTDTSKPRPIVRLSPEKRDVRSRQGSGENFMPDRLKRTALYHPPQLRSRGDPMTAAFELALDPSSGQLIQDNSKDDLRLPVAQPDASPSAAIQCSITEHWSLVTTSVSKRPLQTVNSGAVTIPRPEVPPRTKFLSPSERTLPASSFLSASTSTLPSSSPSLSSSPSALSINSSTKSTSSLPSFPSSQQPHSADSSSFVSPDSPVLSHMPSQTKSMKLIPKLTIRTHNEESEAVRTPLKPTMGVSMIGKQRRTPSIISPREIFFSSPPSSPMTPYSPDQSVLLSPGSSSTSGILTTATCVVTSCAHNLSGKISTPSKMHNQKILPHYPGMEYPPVFEPGSYSLCGSPSDQPQSLYQMPNPAPPHLSDQQGRTHDQTEISGSYANVETHAMFSLDQADTVLDIPQRSNKFLHSEITSQEMQSGSTDGETQLQQSVSNYEFKIQKNIPVSNPTGFAVDHNLHVNKSASHQNLRVATPPGAVSRQNLYASDSGSGIHHPTYVSTSVSISHQNLHVSTHQNVYVTTPVQSVTDHNVCVSLPSVLNSHQNRKVSIASGRTESGHRDECGEQIKPVCSFIPSAESHNLETNNPTTPSSKSYIPPRLLLPRPSDSPSVDGECEVKVSPTQRESSA